jgi:alpha-ketoglutarate-dependent taurine dioxygenase
MHDLQCRFDVARPEQSFLAVIEARETGAPALAWARDRVTELHAALRTYGAVMLRGFAAGLDDFDAIGDLFSAVPSSPLGQVSPRHRVAGAVYTATDLGEKHAIRQHHEMAYDLHPPRYVLFTCRRAPRAGGETPVGDARALYRKLGPALLERFARRGILYQRNFMPGCPGKTARQTFHFDDPAELTAYGAAAGIDFEWRGEDHLRALQLRGAIATHPDTGEPVFFNLAHIWHWTNMVRAAAAFGPEYAEVVRNTAPEDQWYNAFYGDGEPIEDDVIAEIHARHEEEAVALPWREGDILVIDNLLASHGRRAFDSEREILATIRGPFEQPYRPARA